MSDVVDRPLQLEATGPSHDGQVVLKDLSMMLPPVQVMAFRARWRGQEHGDGHDQRTGRAGSGTGPRLGWLSPGAGVTQAFGGDAAARIRPAACTGAARLHSAFRGMGDTPSADQGVSRR